MPMVFRPKLSRGFLALVTLIGFSVAVMLVVVWADSSTNPDDGVYHLQSSQTAVVVKVDQLRFDNGLDSIKLQVATVRYEGQEGLVLVDSTIGIRPGEQVFLYQFTAIDPVTRKLQMVTMASRP